MIYKLELDSADIDYILDCLADSIKKRRSTIIELKKKIETEDIKSLIEIHEANIEVLKNVIEKMEKQIKEQTK